MKLKKFPYDTGEISKDGYEQAEVEALPGLLRGCKQFFDVGANVGLYTYYANQILENATIYCMEADPRNFENLRRHCETWAAEGSNRIIPVHGIVTDRPGTHAFLTSKEKTVGSIFTTPAMAAFEREDRVDVECVRLDDFYEADKRPVIKMDIEGGEYRALLGARSFLDAPDTIFFMEIHWWGDTELNKRPSDIAALFFRHRFAARLIGTHWHFSKQGVLRSWLSALTCFPRFALQLQGRQYVKKKLGRLFGRPAAS